MNQKGFSSIIVLFIVMLVAIAGAGYFIYSQQEDNNEKSNNTTGDSELKIKSDQSLDIDTSLTTTTLKSHVSDMEVSVKHPADWEVSQSQEEFVGLTLGTIEINSPNGNKLTLREVDGLGGGCPGNNNEYTLVKRIETTHPDIVFSEYDVAYERGLDLEHFTESNEELRFMKEGETRRNDCNLTAYPTISNGEVPLGDMTTTDDIFVSVNDGKTSYASLQSDPDFIEMLASLSVSF